MILEIGFAGGNKHTWSEDVYNDDDDQQSDRFLFLN